MNCRNKITSLALVLVGSCYGLTASAKCGSVDYTQGADALATGEDGITKSIMTLIGAIIFMISASIVFPAFFGYQIYT